jgi:hypothetical protein
MWTPAIVKIEIMADRIPSVADAVVGPQIHLLVFEAAPQSLDEHAVPPSPFAVHADSDGEHAAPAFPGLRRKAFVDLESLTARFDAAQ